MQMLSLVWGIWAILVMIVAFIPCLGALNWLNIPFSGLGIIIAAIAFATGKEQSKGGAIAGLVCCVIAIFFGIIRLVIGGCIF
jgi:hypothetical protein